MYHTPQSLQAEISYRQERIKRDFQRPAGSSASQQAGDQRPCLPAVQARHAM